MKSNILKKLLFSSSIMCILLFCFTSLSFATFTFGTPSSGGSWSLVNNDYSGPPQINQLDMYMVSNDDTFADPAFTNFNDGSWSQWFINSANTVASARGNLTASLTFDINFNDDITDPLEFDLLGWQGSTLITSANLVWDGTEPFAEALHGSQGTSGTYNKPIPEPTTWLLFGTGFLGLLGFSRKKFMKKS